MPLRAKPKEKSEHEPARGPGALGLDFLDDIAKQAKPEIKHSNTDDLERSLSDNVKRSGSDKILSARQSASRASKHHVSLYIAPAVDRAMKRIALDEECKPWEAYHQALREYLDRHGQSFDELMRG